MAATAGARDAVVYPNAERREPRVVDRELTSSDLNSAVLLDLVRSEDPLGVVSIYDSARRFTGGISPDGSLFADGERLGLGKEEPRLLERIVERALDTGARVTPVGGPAAGQLADADGIAALLRW